MKTFRPLFLISIFSLLVNTIFSQGTWISKANFGGQPRWSAAGFSIGTKGYIGTGGNSSCMGFKDFWEFDQTTNAWTQMADFAGAGREYAVGFSIGTKGYIGVGRDGTGPLQDFWEWDQALNTWSKKADFGGSARMAAVGFSIGTKGYIGTGLNGGTLQDFWEWDQASDTWIQKAVFGGVSRWSAAGFSIGKKGYIGTGNNTGNTTQYKDFWEWDQVTNTWTQKADFGGTARSGAVGFSIGSRGYIGTGTNSNFCKDFWEWDQAANAWTQKGDFGGTDRYASVGFSIGCNGYIGTGLSNNSEEQDFWVYNSLSLPPPLCLVTVDSLSKFNNIVWDKTPYANAVDSFIIYREITTNNYKRISSVHYNHLSLFEDTVKTKYFPNTGDPNSGTYRYKLQLRDTCGNYSQLGPFHNTIYISNNSGVFSWPQLYTIEGESNPVSSYVLLRDDNSSGNNFLPVNSVAGTQQTVTDPNYATFQSTATWRVESVWSISCTPSLKNPDPMAAAINKTRSNSYKTAATGLDSYSVENIVSVYPNPSNGHFIISVENRKSVEGFQVKLFDMVGREVYKNSSDLNIINVNTLLPQGIYQLKIEMGIESINKRIIIQ